VKWVAKKTLALILPKSRSMSAPTDELFPGKAVGAI